MTRIVCEKHNDDKLRLNFWEVAEYVTNFTPYIQIRTDFSDEILSIACYRGLDNNGKVLKLG